jgi:3-hydroxyisobutyrate dehydrogenase
VSKESKEKKVTNVAFIGLGNIGYPMAENLVDSAFNTIVYDVFAEPVERLVKKGAVAASKLADLSDCDVIGVCVRDDNDVNTLLHGDEGLLKHCKKGAIIAIHSTVTQQAMIDWAAEGETAAIHIVDAPITGGEQGARDKALCYMVGGSLDVLEKLTPVLETSAKKVVHAGDVGSGIALKLCNNLINYAAFTAIDEANRLAVSSGLNPELVYEVGEVNGIVTEMMKRFISGREMMKPACSDEDFKAIFGPFAALAEKDLDAALASAKATGVSLPATEKVRDVISGAFFKTN